MNTIQRSLREDTRLAEEVAQQAQSLVNSHTHFTGRAHGFEFVVRNGVLILRGSVPSFYLKQVLQHTLKNLDGVRRIDNQVTVVSSEGLSSLDNGLS